MVSRIIKRLQATVQKEYIRSCLTNVCILLSCSSSLWIFYSFLFLQALLARLHRPFPPSLKPHMQIPVVPFIQTSRRHFGPETAREPVQTRLIEEGCPSQTFKSELFDPLFDPRFSPQVQMNEPTSSFWIFWSMLPPAQSHTGERQRPLSGSRHRHLGGNYLYTSKPPDYGR